MNDKDNEQKQKKRIWSMVFLLLILILLTILLSLWRLGYFADRYMGHVIDTIVVSPEQTEDYEQALCVRLKDQKGKALTGYELELHSEVQYAITGECGFALFRECVSGLHTLTVMDAEGKTVVSTQIYIAYSEKITKGSQLYQGYVNGTYYLSVPLETMLIELDIILEGDILTLVPESVTALTNQSSVYTYYGIVNAIVSGAILTSHGSLMLTDGTVWIHEGSALLPNGIYVDTDGKVYKNGNQISRSELPDSYYLNLIDMTLTTPDGSVIYLKETRVLLPNGAVIIYDGTVQYPDGTIIRKPISGHGYIIVIDKDSSEPSRPIEEEDEALYVFDSESDKEWHQISTIDLFKDGGLIYPGAEGKYDFYLKNGVKGMVTFSVTLEERYHEVGAVPLEYKLRDQYGYIVGTTTDEWLTAEELQTITVTLKKKGIANYTLAWRWPYEQGDNQTEIDQNNQYDTELANTKNRTHYITMKIHAEAN